ncbi:DUF5658 family protein [Metabacillus litoralis]|uniref:DUF5658 family protein n=1 Tax=Metabacillus litoralis TaxID=152268 RepID=UPI001CFDCC95|nr:DUF5658 family protein [Metabacillus litoralis]
MKFICHYLALINLVDAHLTFIGLSLDLIEEVNPLMRALYEMSPVYFLFTKLLLSALLYLVIYFDKLPRFRLIKIIGGFGACLYTGVMVLHIGWLFETFI